MVEKQQTDRRTGTKCNALLAEGLETDECYQRAGKYRESANTQATHTHTHKVLQKPFTRCRTAFFCCCKLYSIKCYLLWAAWLLPCTLHKPKPVSVPQHPTYYHVSVFLPAFTDARHERSAPFQTNDRNQWSDIYRNEAGEQMNLIRLLPSRQLRNWITSGYVCVSKEGIKTFVKQPSALSDLAIVFDSMAGIKAKAYIYFY